MNSMWIHFPNRRSMDAAWQACAEEELSRAIAVNPEDAQSFFEDGWRAAIDWMKERNRG